MSQVNNISGEITVATIKGTAMNRDKPRIWLEKQAKVMQGWNRHDKYTLTIEDDALVITRDDAGDRAVAGRTRNGKDICIFDLTCTEQQRQRILSGSDTFTVRITKDQIIFTAS